MMQGNNTICKHFTKAMPYCFQVMCWSYILQPPQMLEDPIKLIIEMFLPLRESKIFDQL